MQIPVTCICGTQKKTLFLRRIFSKDKDEKAKDLVAYLNTRCVFCSKRALETGQSASAQMRAVAKGPKETKKKKSSSARNGFSKG